MQKKKKTEKEKHEKEDKHAHYEPPRQSEQIMRKLGFEEEREMTMTDNPSILAAEISAINPDSPDAMERLIHFTTQLAIAVATGKAREARDTAEQLPAGGGGNSLYTCPNCGNKGNLAPIQVERPAMHNCYCNNCGTAFPGGA